MREKIFEAGIGSALELSSECVEEQEFNPVGNSFSTVHISAREF